MRGGLAEVRLVLDRRRLTPEGVRIAKTILDTTGGGYHGADASEVWGSSLPRDIHHAARQMLDVVEDHSTPFVPLFSRRKDDPVAQERLVEEEVTSGE